MRIEVIKTIRVIPEKEGDPEMTVILNSESPFVQIVKADGIKETTLSSLKHFYAPFDLTDPCSTFKIQAYPPDGRGDTENWVRLVNGCTWGDYVLGLIGFEGEPTWVIPACNCSENHRVVQPYHEGEWW